MVNNNNNFNEITPYIYGTTRLGDDNISQKERIEIALAAMKAGVWFGAD